MQTIPFAKYSGSGNTFILIQNHSFLNEDLSLLAQQICSKRYGIPSDGLLLISPSSKADFALRMLNKDGSFASMCGNGLRCACAHYYQNTSASSSSLSIETDAGILYADIQEGKIRCTLSIQTPPSFVSVETPKGRYEGYFCNTGVPHYVIQSGDVQKVAIQKIAPALRCHEKWGPQGVNVNFVQVIDRENLKVRTYERGVEGETLACGTGCGAVFLSLLHQNLVEKRVFISVLSGDTLVYELCSSQTIYMTGNAQKLLSGEWCPPKNPLFDELK